MMKQTSSTKKGHAAVRAALAKIIDLHNDFPAVLREAGDGCSSTKKSIVSIGSHTASNVDNIGKKEIKGKESKIIHRSEQPGNEVLNKEEVHTDATYEDLSDITKKVILEQIEVEAESLGIEVSVAATSMVLAQVKLLARLIQDGQDCHSDLEGLISTTHFLISRKMLATTDVGEQLLKENAFFSLPLTFLWRFSCIGVVSVEQIIKCIHDSKPTNLSIVDDLLQLVLYKKMDNVSTSAVSGILSVLIGIAYDLVSEKYLSLCRFANDVLNSLTTKLLDHIIENENRSEKNVCKEKFHDNGIHMHTEDSQEERKNEYSGDSETREIPIMNIFGIVSNNLSVTSEALESYCSAQLIYILTHRPNLQLGRVLRKQEKWRSTRADTTLSALMQKLVVVLGHEATLNTLDLVVTNDEVNWCCVLTLVATALNCHRATATTLKRMIKKKIQHGCEDQEMDLLIIGFLFARHASQEGRHIFPSYPQWFSSLFATESGSPASNKQAFVFLVRFMSDLVPHEPAYCLRAHVTSHIFTPKGCQEVLRDYYHLARARLQELKDSLNPNDDQQSSKISSKVVEEVEAAVNHFSETGKIPNFVLEASIFRIPYFCSAFLPALLVSRPIPDVPDARAKLIEALHSAGKIPSNMFNNYIEACQKEVSDLLADVFMSDQDVIEEPITELSNMLQELVNHSSCSQGRDEASSSMVLPVLSQISQKIEEIMRISDSRLKNISYIIINVRTFNAKLITYQVVEKIIGIVERLCFTSYPEGNIKKRRPSWLTQFVSLLSSSITLQQALFTHLVHTLEGGQQGEIASDQIKKCGIILSEIWRIEGLFLPVTEGSTPNQKALPFTQYFLNKLGLSSQQAFVFACSILNAWLKWYILSEDDAATGEPSLHSLPTQLLDMYCCLAPRLPLICSHQSEKEVTVADVYSYLDGCNVPEYSRLYFTHICKYGEKHKVSLEKWVIFELKATWNNTPIDVRQTYLKCRVLQDFVSPATVASDCQQEMVTARNSSSTTNVCVSLSNILVQIVFALLEIGLNQQNSNEILMLIQSLAHHIPDSSICLLQEWHKRFTEGIVLDTSVLTFISICRCLPPSFFLRADQLLQLSGVLRSFIDQLLATTQDIQPSVCDTVFLCSALLNAAARPGVKNLQVQQCLTPLKTPIVVTYIHNTFVPLGGTQQLLQELQCSHQ
ncbi:uncharacterized protein [Panulirus ornatus]|uniref:uncharacterized protein isoform X2 n=1 Tax=Panulirus ornatus TaxID=150431 RepID=UPI003A8977AF